MEQLICNQCVGAPCIIKGHNTEHPTIPEECPYGYESALWEIQEEKIIVN